MKKIENKTTTIIEDEKNMTYSDLIGICLNSPVEGGYSVDEMEARLRIKAGTTPAEKSEFKIEDADFDKLKGLVVSSAWAIIHQ